MSTNKSSVRRSLIVSATALVLTVAMLIGTTFAWFTDSVSSGINTIKSGNLDVVLKYKNSNAFEDVSETTSVFSDNSLWEPGHVEYAVLKVVNNGTLALKYKLSMNVASETAGKRIADNAEFKLSDYLKYAVVDGDLSTSAAQDAAGREAILREAGDGTTLSDMVAGAKEGHLKAYGNSDSTQTVTVVVWMPTTVGNEANHNGTDIPEIQLGVNLVATQDTVENDSFGNTYDENATYPVTSSSELTSAIASANDGDIFAVANDIDLPKTVAVSDKDVTLDMNNKSFANTAELWENGGSDDWSLVSAQNAASLTITGNGTFKAKENDCYAVDVRDGSTVTIENGTFDGNIHAVYVLKGTAYIKGGTFSVQQKYPDANKADGFVLNCLDANHKNGTAKIIVTGGTFVNFNPADCWAEGEHTNFVADGYKVTSKTQTNGDIWYTVVPE